MRKTNLFKISLIGLMTFPIALFSSPLFFEGDFKDTGSEEYLISCGGGGGGSSIKAKKEKKARQAAAKKAFKKRKAAEKAAAGLPLNDEEKALLAE